tara:strand:- start:435 stop:1772 length:1338 start_codon:yes stop_codon:yes gene_type:complete
MSRASRLSGFTTAISGDTDLNVGIVTATQINTDQTLTFTNLNVTGIATIPVISGVTTIGSDVVVGGATTALVVNGDARVTGILTVGTSSLTLNGTDGTVSGINTINGITYPSAGGLTNRNMIINGAMRVSQRGTSFTGLTVGQYTVDRMLFGMLNGNSGTWTVEQSTDAPDGFKYSVKCTNTTAFPASPAAGAYMYFPHVIESQDLQHLKFGTSEAETTTISFWVKSNVTGNYSFGVLQTDNSLKQVAFGYTINAASTWEYKTITIPGDTAGVIDNDNEKGLQLEWWLNSGTNYTGGSAQSTWITFDNTHRNFNNPGVGNNTSDFWQITGIQFEVGDRATPFEHRSYNDDLQKCRRYYQHFVSGGGGTPTGGGQTQSAMCTVNYSPEMRDTPTVTMGTINTGSNNSGTLSVFVARKYGCSPGAQSSAAGRQYWGVGLSTASSEMF